MSHHRLNIIISYTVHFWGSLILTWCSDDVSGLEGEWRGRGREAVQSMLKSIFSLSVCSRRRRLQFERTLWVLTLLTKTSSNDCDETSFPWLLMTEASLCNKGVLDPPAICGANERKRGWKGKKWTWGIESGRKITLITLLGSPSTERPSTAVSAASFQLFIAARCREGKKSRKAEVNQPHSSRSEIHTPFPYLVGLH